MGLSSVLLANGDVTLPRIDFCAAPDLRGLPLPIREMRTNPKGKRVSSKYWPKGDQLVIRKKNLWFPNKKFFHLENGIVSRAFGYNCSFPSERCWGTDFNTVTFGIDREK